MYFKKIFPSLFCAFSTDCGKQLLSMYGTCSSIKTHVTVTLQSFKDALIIHLCLHHQAGQLFIHLFLQEVAGVGPQARSIKVSSEGDGDTGSVILGISGRLVSAIVQPGQNKTKKTVKSPILGKRCSF